MADIVTLFTGATAKNAPLTVQEMDENFINLNEQGLANVHPLTHPPGIIAQDANNRFVTDAEKAVWNANQVALISGTHIKTINGESVVGSGDLVIATDKNLDGGTSSSVFSYADFQIDCGESI